VRKYVRNQCRLRYWGVLDWFEYSDPPALWIMAPLLAMAGYVLTRVPSDLGWIMVMGALALAVLAVASIPLWLATLAVWEGALDCLWTMYRLFRQELAQRRLAADPGPLVIHREAPQGS
jgi:hypothetical protein